MKRISLLALVFLTIFLRVHAQDSNPQKLYLLMEFMHVSDANGSNYMDVEQFWSGIHKQRVADKKIVGWDLWSLSPSGSNQGAQYMTVTLFSSLKDMLEAATSMDAMGYAKKAYPKKSEKELTDMFDKTGKSRDRADQVFFEQVDMTKGDFTMKVGTIATMDVMKQKEENYEKAESDIFKPWHQSLVDAGKKGSWQILRAILPSGSDSYGTHLTVSMYKDADQLASFMQSSGGEMDLKTQLAVNEGLKTREWKQMKVGTLLMMVR
jgi:hypothetical protein